MSMKSLAIKDFAEVITGGTPSTSIAEYWNGDIPWLNSGELNKGIIFNASNFITKKGLSKSNAKLMPIDTVLIALTGTTTGATALLKIEACANQSVTGILPSVSHVPKYLYFYLRSIRKEIMDKSYGGAQKHISQQFVKDIQVPLPSIEEQHRIVKILDLAQSLIEKRIQAIAYLDDYIKAVFLDMFGDPVSNPKGWEVKYLNDCVEIQSGQVDPKSMPYSKMIHIGSADIEKGTGLIINKISSQEANQTSGKYYFDKNHLLYSKIRPNLNKVAKPDFEGICSADIYPIRPKEQLNKCFLFFILKSNSFLEYAIKNSRRASIPKINRPDLLKYKMIVPPSSEQNLFAEKVLNSESLKQKMQDQLKELEDNYQAQLQRAFKGE